MKKRNNGIGTMAEVLLASGGTVLQPIRTPSRVKNPNRPEDKFAMSRAKQKRERKRFKRARRKGLL